MSDGPSSFEDPAKVESLVAQIQLAMPDAAIAEAEDKIDDRQDAGGLFSVAEMRSGKVLLLVAAPALSNLNSSCNADMVSNRS